MTQYFRNLIDLDESPGVTQLTDKIDKFYKDRYYKPSTFEVKAKEHIKLRMDERCDKDHRTTSCELDFLYDGKHHSSCITSQPSPSSKDDDCIKLRKAKPETQNITVYLFHPDKTYLTTCYPLFGDKNSKGWCSTRRSGKFRDAEPEPTKGWGFCSNDEVQKHCNGHIQTRTDVSPREASVLEDSYCVNALKDNLHVEQPNVRQGEYDPLLIQHEVFCIGQNHSHSFEDEVFYIVGKHGKYVKSKSKSEKSELQVGLIMLIAKLMHWC